MTPNVALISDALFVRTLINLGASPSLASEEKSYDDMVSMTCDIDHLEHLNGERQAVKDSLIAWHGDSIAREDSRSFFAKADINGDIYAVRF